MWCVDFKWVCVELGVNPTERSHGSTSRLSFRRDEGSRMCTNVNKEDYLKLKAGKRVRDFYYFYYYYYLGLTCVNVWMVLMFNLSVPEDLSRRACVLSSGRKNLLSCNSSPIDYPLPNPNHIPPVQMPFPAQQLLSLTTSVGLNIPPPPCLPVYSTSGFDVMSILARIATCSHPKIILGPVDLACSFVVVDVRRFDWPIVYTSPSLWSTKIMKS